MSCESSKDRQENEIEVLKSIFGDELCDLRCEKNKRKWQPLDILISLMPQKGMSGPAKVYAQIDLHVMCSTKYPDESTGLVSKTKKTFCHYRYVVYRYIGYRLNTEKRSIVSIILCNMDVQMIIN